MKSPLETLVGQTAARALLYLKHYGEAYATGLARDLGLRLNAVQRQLEKLEDAGFLVSKKTGRTRVYRLDPKNPAAMALGEFLTTFYEAMSLEERESIFSIRRRPRRTGKPVRSGRVART